MSNDAYDSDSEFVDAHEEETKSDDGFHGTHDDRGIEETKSDDGVFYDTEPEIGSEIIYLYRELSQLNDKLCEGYCKKRDSGWISYIKTKTDCKNKNCASVIKFLIYLHDYLKDHNKNEELTFLIEKMYNTSYIIPLKKLGKIGDNFESIKEFKEWLNTLTKKQKEQIRNYLQELNILLNKELDKSEHSNNIKSKRYVEIVKTQTKKHKDMWGIPRALYAASAGRTRKKSKHHKRSRKHGRRKGRNLRPRTKKG